MYTGCAAHVSPMAPSMLSGLLGTVLGLLGTWTHQGSGDRGLSLPEVPMSLLPWSQWWLLSEAHYSVYTHIHTHKHSTHTCTQYTQTYTVYTHIQSHMYTYIHMYTHTHSRPGYPCPLCLVPTLHCIPSSSWSKCEDITLTRGAQLLGIPKTLR